jgi:hypothetical protein
MTTTMENKNIKILSRKQSIISQGQCIKNMKNLFHMEKNDKILILGETDFSLTKAILAVIENPKNIFSTSHSTDKHFVIQMENKLPCNVIHNINPMKVPSDMFAFQFEFIFFFFPMKTDINSLRSFFTHIYDFLKPENNGRIFLALQNDNIISQAELKEIVEDLHFYKFKKTKF